MCPHHNESLHQCRGAATNWSKRSKAEPYDKDAYSGSLPRADWGSCTGGAVSNKHPRCTHAQKQEAPAGRTIGEHRKQSLHDSTVSGSRSRREYHKEAKPISPFEGPTLAGMVV